MFKFKKKSASRRKCDDVIETANNSGSKDTMVLSSHSLPNGFDSESEDFQNNYGTPQDGKETTKSSRAGLLRRKKSLKNNEEKARSRAMKLCTDFETNATDEYLALNTEAKIRGTKSRSSTKGISSLSVSTKGGSSMRDLRKNLSRKKSLNSVSYDDSLRYTTSMSSRDNSDAESVFSNPFEDESDCETVGSYQSASTMPASAVDLRKVVPKSNFADLYMSKELAKVNPFDDGRSKQYDDDSSVGSYGSAYSHTSGTSMSSYYSSRSRVVPNTAPAISSSSYVYGDKLKAYTPRSSANHLPSTTEAMLLFQARQATEQRQPRPKLHQVSDYSSDSMLSPYDSECSSTKRRSKSKKSDPVSPDNSTTSNGSLRSRIFSRKSKTTDLRPPAFM